MSFVWGGHNSLRAWAAARPDQLQALRQQKLLCAAPVGRRHGFYCPTPYALATLCDARSSKNCKAYGVEAFLNKNPCCLMPGSPKEFRKHRATREDVCTEEARFVASACALACAFSLPNDERQHASRKRRNEGAAVGPSSTESTRKR